MANLGNIGASALVKSAASIASQVTAYQDKVAALQWQYSAQTATDWASYQQYLTTRISNLQATTSLANESKALTLQSTLGSANRSFISNQIQVASQNIMEGTGTATDKANAIRGFYDQAVANGDYNTAQNLRSSYDTLSQQINYDAITAGKAAATASAADATAIKSGYDGAIAAINQKLSDLTSNYSQGGQADITKALQSFATSIAPIAKSMGITIPTGSAANNGSIIQGVIQTIAAYHYNAAQAELTQPGASNPGSPYMQEMNSFNQLSQGYGQVHFGGQNFNYQDATFYAAHPDAYIQKTTGTDIQGNPTYTLAKAATVGYTYNQQGTVVPIFSKTQTNNDAVANKTAEIASLKSIGLDAKMNADGEIIATPTLDSGAVNNALQNYGISQGTQLVVVKTDTGFQVAPVTDNGGSQHLLTISTDTGGHVGVYAQQFNNTTGGSIYNLISKSSGFDPLNNSVTKVDPGSTVQAAIAQAIKAGGTDNQSFVNGTVVPNLAKTFFNGDTSLAAQAFSSAQTARIKAAQPQDMTSKIPANLNAPLPNNPAAGTLAVLGMPYIGPRPSTPQGSARMVKTSGGFNFYDASGRPINAAQYSQASGIGYRALLSNLASQGDSNSKIALNYVGNDAKFGNAPLAVKGALTALGATGSFSGQPSTPPPFSVNASGMINIPGG